MGSGKSTTAKVLRELGFQVVDADKIVRDLTAPGTPLAREILSTFGPAVVARGGGVDRGKLGRMVFQDKSKLAALEGLVHPKVREEVSRIRGELEKAGEPAAFYDVPLLFEKNMESQFDFILVVSASEDVRRARLMERMQISAAEITARFQNQIPPEVKEARASAVIRNDGGHAELVAEVRRALAKIGLKSPTAG
jgi:dephospho-CoA kinase